MYTQNLSEMETKEGSEGGRGEIQKPGTCGGWWLTQGGFMSPADTHPADDPIELVTPGCSLNMQWGQ